MDNSTLPMRTVFWRLCYWKNTFMLNYLFKVWWRLFACSQQMHWTKNCLAGGEGTALTIALCLCSPPCPLKILDDFPCPSYLFFAFPVISSPYSCKWLLNLFLQVAVPIVWHFTHLGFAELAAWALVWLPCWLLMKQQLNCFQSYKVLPLIPCCA